MVDLSAVIEELLPGIICTRQASLCCHSTLYALPPPGSWRQSLVPPNIRVQANRGSLLALSCILVLYEHGNSYV